MYLLSLLDSSGQFSAYRFQGLEKWWRRIAERIELPIDRNSSPNCQRTWKTVGHVSRSAYKEDQPSLQRWIFHFLKVFIVFWKYLSYKLNSILLPVGKHRNHSADRGPAQDKGSNDKGDYDPIVLIIPFDMNYEPTVGIDSEQKVRDWLPLNEVALRGTQQSFWI